MELKFRLDKVKVADLHPTQMTIGYRAVKHKRQEWKEACDSRSGRRQFIEAHVIPVVIGPDAEIYATDHHHVARALVDEGIDKVFTAIFADLSALPKMTFWNFMDQRSWCRPVDDHGRRQDFDKIPKVMHDLLDDPYRSLSAAVERAGGFAKDGQPFDEFLWADFFRNHMRRKTLEGDFDAAVEKAIKLAGSKDAKYLPGWCACAS